LLRDCTWVATFFNCSARNCCALSAEGAFCAAELASDAHALNAINDAHRVAVQPLLTFFSEWLYD
jgi:hypothetical protein